MAFAALAALAPLAKKLATPLVQAALPKLTEQAIKLAQEYGGDTVGAIAAQALPGVSKVISNTLFATPKQSIPEFLQNVQNPQVTGMITPAQQAERVRLSRLPKLSPTLESKIFRELQFDEEALEKYPQNVVDTYIRDMDKINQRMGLKEGFGKEIPANNLLKPHGLPFDSGPKLPLAYDQFPLDQLGSYDQFIQNMAGKPIGRTIGRRVPTPALRGPIRNTGGFQQALGMASRTPSKTKRHRRLT